MTPTDKLMNVVADNITKLADTLSKTAPQLWHIMLRQQYISAITDSLTVITLSIMVPSCFWVLMKIFPNLKNSREEYLFIKGIFLATGFIMAAITICVCLSNLQVLLNPEYYALKELIEMVVK